MWNLNECKDLRAYVEAELIVESNKLGVSMIGWRFDWSDTCPEGHPFQYLDGLLENLGNVSIFGLSPDERANGSIDWVLDAQEGRPRIYWEDLYVYQNGVWIQIAKFKSIPDHIWNTLSEESKQIAKKGGAYSCENSCTKNHLD
ncbi:MAG: hypothetical protein HS116_08810 [Planctomycetes bacterium]|nr:hypothetical protein [Planctomycetota bacterium]